MRGRAASGAPEPRSKRRASLCPCGRAARKGHACAVTRLRAELREALQSYDDEVTGRREEVTRLQTELGRLRADGSRILEACDAIPDITLSKWACDPGLYWNPLREAIRARRRGQGFDVDAEPEEFDDRGMLRARGASRGRR